MHSLRKLTIGLVASCAITTQLFADGFADPPPKRATKPQAAKPDPRTPAQIHSQGALKVAPIPGSQRNTGTMVWQVLDGEADFASAPERRPRQQPSPIVEIPAIARVAPVPSDVGPVIYPQPTPRPSLVPEYDFYGEPPLDELLASSIPANAADVPAIDPDRFNRTPVALDMTAATIDEVMRKLVPPRYRLRIDVRSDIRERRDNVLMETDLKSAFAQLEAIWGVKIYPYHKLQVVLVTDLKEIQ